MPLTREAVELLLTRRCGKRLAAVGLYDPTTDTIGAIDALASPIAKALGSLGITVADITDPVDADFADVDVSPSLTSLDQLLDVAELAALEAIWGNMDEPDQKTAQQQQDWNKWADSLWKAIETLRARVANVYGIGSESTFSAGVVDLNFDRGAWYATEDDS